MATAAQPPKVSPDQEPAVVDASFTPGPWSVFPVDPGERPGIEGADHVSIVVFGTSDDDAGVHGDTPEEAEANARLIAAAPDLLETCKVIAKAELYDAATGIIDADVLEVCQDLARAAIARVTTPTRGEILARGMPKAMGAIEAVIAAGRAG